MEVLTILKNVREVSARSATERSERQQRRGLVSADFAQLREAGFPSWGCRSTTAVSVRACARWRVLRGGRHQGALRPRDGGL